MPSSSPSSPRPPAKPDAAAAHWLARRDAGLTAAEQAEFQQWWAADPRHAAAWQDVESAWRAFDAPRADGLADGMVRELKRRRSRRLWRVSLAVGSSLAAAAAIVVLVMRPDPSHGIISRTEQRVLADGSRVELNRDAEIDVRFEPARRSVRLIRGEALFTVAHDSARPFIVSTGRVDVQAIGTAFSVQTNADAVDVVVTEGRVSVGRSDTGAVSGTQPASRPEPVLVGAGDRLLVPVARTPDERLQAVPLAPADLERRLAWRGPRMELSATRLRDAVALLNRENRVQLKVPGQELGEMRLSGVFRADDAEGFARLLEANYEVRIERHGNELELRGR